MDLNEILDKYYKVSQQLGEDFFAEFQVGLSKTLENPQRFHLDPSGLRRWFPYHFLYDIRGAYIRIWVLRHNRRNPDFGVGRFPVAS